MWKVIYVTSAEKLARRIEEALTREGFLAQVRPSISKQYEIQVPASEVRDAQEILNQILQTPM
ncbi:MAG: glutamate decarboxylase [Bacillus thermozeamaize]|jgi:phosphoribosylformylglycinamidine (FGAM) synthase PurS component|uniref:Glutamate decarboxylase n=1 Tax=Bacillus thermozeamaize TaxID=230954 RepID=A0A1Y3PH97_9BACI|nr:MAG: glutamate decarboxylase [Bacillus thermozeamaize]